MAMTKCVVAIASFIPLLPYVSSQGFLKQDPRAHPLVDFGERQHGFNEAISAIMGCSSFGEERMTNLSKVEEALAPMWKVLPKSTEGQVDWKIVRYLTHRYFMQQSSLLIRGLEPTIRVNDSNVGIAEVLNHESFSFVESALAGKRAIGGFSLEDSAALVATLERVIYDSETEALEKSYRFLHGERNQPNSRPFNRLQFFRLIETYMVYWLSGGDDYIASACMKNRTLLVEVFPSFDSTLTHFIDGVIHSFEYARTRSAKYGSGRTLMTRQFSLDDAHSVVGDITKRFASYWESECQTIKRSLVSLDRSGTGRIMLSDFYGANVDGDWRFSESEQYLRELGALDDTSSRFGSQVIITNYLLGASNCIVTAKNYFVCCVNECETILNEIEMTIGEPVALPADILLSLSNITNLEDDALKITTAMKAQLQRIADTHGGRVPLHGRLFAQWLHFAMPHECPFPHKTGTHASKSVSEDDGSYLASESDIVSYAGQRGSQILVDMAETEEAQLMSLWSEEEELLVDYPLHVRSPWELERTGAMVSFIVLLAIGVMLVSRAGKTSGVESTTLLLEACSKAHFV